MFPFFSRWFSVKSVSTKEVSQRPESREQELYVSTCVRFINGMKGEKSQIANRQTNGVSDVKRTKFQSETNGRHAKQSEEQGKTLERSRSEINQFQNKSRQFPDCPKFRSVRLGGCFGGLVPNSNGGVRVRS